MDHSKISVIDYVVFGLSLVIPVIIATYFTFVNKQKSNTSFLLGDRALTAVPISFSLAVSYLSAVTITGIPGEIAYHGWLFPVTWLLSATLALILVGNLLIPIFYKMKLTSVYEYLELRYQSRAVRLLASISYIISVILYLGVVLYAPCLALHTITDLSVISLILIGGIVGTIYTVMGGMKTVVWTDLFQALVMITGLVSIIVRGSNLAGGMKRVWEVGSVTQRIEWTNWDPSPFSRNTTLGIFCGQFILWGAIFGCHQTQVQRYCATKSLQQARWALMMSVFLLWILTGCAIIAGLVVYATYWSCDPKSLGLIEKKDELITFFVIDHLIHFYGLPGLFIASLLSSALSTMSSGLNSLAAVVWEDILKPMSWTQTMSDKHQVMITRCLATFAGVLTIGLAILTSSGIDGVLQLGNTAMSVLAGPLLALFLLGFFTHTANKIGAISGLVVANCFTIWLFVGSSLYRPQGPNTKLDTFTEGCITQEEDELYGVNTTTTLIRSNVFLDVQAIVRNRSQTSKTFFYIPEGDWQTVLYSTSYHLYALIGFLVCLLVCLVVSLVSRLFVKFKDVEPLLLHPLVRNRSKCRCCQTCDTDKSTVSVGKSHQFRSHLHNGPNIHKTFHLGSGHDWDDMTYYNRWPSPSLPPTLKKNIKVDPSGNGLHLSGGYSMTSDENGNGVTILAPSDNDTELKFHTLSGHTNNNNNNNNSNTLSHIKKKVSNSNGQGTLDRTDLARNRLGILDSMSLNSVPVIVNTNSNKVPRKNSKFEEPTGKDSFGSSNPYFNHRPQNHNDRKVVRRSDSENDEDDFTSQDVDDFSIDYPVSKPPLRLNGKKLQVMHNKISQRRAETVSDEDGWTTDF